MKLCLMNLTIVVKHNLIIVVKHKLTTFVKHKLTMFVKNLTIIVKRWLTIFCQHDFWHAQWDPFSFSSPTMSLIHLI